MNIAPGNLQIGEWTFDASSYRLVKGRKQVKLESRVAQLLLHLAENQNIAVSRKLLMDKTWPGVVIGDEALTNAVNKLRKALGDDPDYPKIIETIPKVGYRLVAPVRHIPQATPERQAESILETTTSVYRKSLIAAALIAACLALVFYIMWNQQATSGQLQQDAPSPKIPGKPTLAVLLFDNPDEDPEQEQFADGIADDIITHQTKSLNIIVAAIGSSFIYKKIRT